MLDVKLKWYIEIIVYCYVNSLDFIFVYKNGKLKNIIFFKEMICSK